MLKTGFCNLSNASNLWGWGQEHLGFISVSIKKDLDQAFSGLEIFFRKDNIKIALLPTAPWGEPGVSYMWINRPQLLSARVEKREQ